MAARKKDDQGEVTPQQAGTAQMPKETAATAGRGRVESGQAATAANKRLVARAASTESGEVEIEFGHMEPSETDEPNFKRQGKSFVLDGDAAQDFADQFATARSVGATNLASVKARGSFVNEPTVMQGARGDTHPDFEVPVGERVGDQNVPDEEIAAAKEEGRSPDEKAGR